ncbi:ATP-binding protein [Shewanella litorisediminis]|uniref:histidine kinase n=1 Tax=Shewanella litorisediminis TaxID=1173586 RepID=A0ABX7G657_9GAMM|nr:ATP-binding protein [Shewanella litorisediminis]MCL2917727.1 ATP-binding protein [Shewanella litorisediminis]QRH02846.1 response regulator [Shewanella litorisediminis]
MKLTLKIIFLITLIFSTGVFADIKLSEEENNYIASKKSVKFGVLKGRFMPYWGGMQAQGGFVEEFFTLISDETSLKIEHVYYDSVTDLKFGLDNGYIDAIPGLIPSSDTRQQHLISLPIYEILPAILFSDKKYMSEPMQNLHFGCLSTSFFCEILQLQKVKKITNASSITELTSLFTNSDVDAVITDSFLINKMISNGLQQHGKVFYDTEVSPQDAFAIVASSQPELLSIINKIIEGNNLKERFIHEIQHDIDYKNIQANNNIIHSDLEKTTIRYTLDDDSFPLSYYDPHTVSMKGYIHDLLSLIENKTVLEFVYVPANGKDVLHMLRNGEVDLLPARNSEGVDLRDFYRTTGYATITFGLVESTRDFAHKKYAILDRTGNYYREIKVNDKYRDIKVYQELSSLLHDLDEGIISHALINNDLLSRLVTEGQDDSFKPIDTPSDLQVNVRLSMVVRHDSPMLYELLQLTLKNISPEQIEALQNAYSKVTIQFGVNEETVLKWVVACTSLALLLAIAFIVWRHIIGKQLNTLERNAELSKSETDWLNTILNNIPNAIVIKNLHGKTILANNSYQTHFSSCRNCGLSKTCQLKSSVDKPDSSDISVISTIELCQRWESYFDISQYQIQHPLKNSPYIMKVYNDVTDLKRKELDLVTANERAMDAISARNHFLAVISHELRTPIAAMLGLLELLSKRQIDDESRLLIENAVSSADQLKYQVNDILDFSKMEAAQLQLDPSWYRIDRELGPLLRSFEASANIKGLHFSVDWKASAKLEARVDVLRLKQILSNLLSNAIKFTESGGIIVTLRLADDHFSFQVSDSGCGMTLEQQKTVFLPFVQADNTISRRFGGTGLGMSIVQNLVKLMEGEIHISSQKDLGTIVTVSIPMPLQSIELASPLAHLTVSDPRWYPWLRAFDVDHSPTEVSAKSEAPIDTSSSSASTPNLYPDLLVDQWQSTLKQNTNKRANDAPMQPSLEGNILVAEDAPINRLLLNRQLSSLGLTANFAKDGHEAFKMLTSPDATYQLLLTDCHMPGMDGFTLVAKVRSELPDYKDIPIIGCTAESSKIAAAKAADVGIDAMLYKPYSLEQLYQMLKQFLPQQTQKTPPPQWLMEYRDEDRIDMATVVLGAMSDDIKLLQLESTDLAALAHRIKGSAGALGLTELRTIAEQAEKAWPSGNVQQARDALIKSIKNLIDSTSEYLQPLTESGT